MPNYTTADRTDPDDRGDRIADTYEASDTFLTDALDWAGTHAYKYPQLVELICAIYRMSPEFETAVEDIADGVRAA